MRSFWTKAAVILAVAAVAGGGGWYAWREKSSPVRKYKTAKAVRGEIRSVVTATGTVNPVTSVLVGTQVSGRIKRIDVNFNSRVRQGQLLAEIDPVQFQAQFDQAKANLSAAKAALEKAEAALRDSERALKRAKGLVAAEVISQNDMDTAETNYEYAVAQAGSARAAREQADAAVEYADTNLRYTRILSPVDGTVVSRNVDVGQTVAASFQTPTLFTIAKDLSRMQIDTAVNEADIGKIVLDQTAEFTVDAYPETPFTGVVSEIRIAPAVVQNVVTYDVVITVDNRSLKLKPGMTANVGIIAAVHKDALKVPNAALRFKPAKKEGEEGEPRNGEAKPEGPGVWILEGGAPRRIPVKSGISDGAMTEMLGGGVAEGMEVILDDANPKGKGQAGGSHRFF